MAREAADNVKRSDGQPPSGSARGAARLTAYFPASLTNASGLSYALDALLRPVGLTVNVVPSADRSALELSWPDVPGRGIAVDAGRVAEAFATLSGQKELDVPRDRLGRVVTARRPTGGATEPTLSLWARELADALAGIHPTWRPPEARLTVHLTHDIDHVHLLEPMGLAGKAIRAMKGLARLRAEPARELVRWVRHRGELESTYQAVMEMERAAGATATYFAMSGPYSLRRHGARYGSRSRALGRVVGLARRLEHRVGLHGSAYSLRRRDWASQRERLCEVFGGEITWHRSHYLVYDPRESPALLESAGVRVDSTVGFHQANGFRAGVAWPYRLWNWTQERPSAVLELPIVFMDRVHSWSDEQEWDELYGLLGRAAEVGGTVAVNFHVDYFIGRPERLEAYRRLLRWLGERRACLSDDLSAFGG